MEMLLEKLRGTVNLKADMVKRCLKRGTVSYCIETRCTLKKAEELIREYLAPLHEKLAGNEDYRGGNIVIFIEPLDEENIPRQVGIMFNKCNWDSLPDDLEFKHGHYCLCVKNIFQRNKKK